MGNKKGGRNLSAIIKNQKDRGTSSITPTVGRNKDISKVTKILTNSEPNTQHRGSSGGRYIHLR